MAAPYVSGTITLMLAVNPCLTPVEIEEVIKETESPCPNANESGEFRRTLAALRGC